jgi:Immunity protein 10
MDRDGGPARPRMTEFVARAAAAWRDDDLGFDAFAAAENEDGSGARLDLQRGFEFDDQDRRLGLDTYCLVTEDGAVHYGGVRDWSLHGNSLEITLTRKAAQVLGVDGFRIRLPPSADLDALARSIALILA